MAVAGQGKYRAAFEKDGRRYRGRHRAQDAPLPALHDSLLLGVHDDGTPCVRPGTGCQTRGCPPRA